MTISPVSGLQSATKIVSPTAGQGNYTTIQAAITAASSGETILIKPGTYTESVTLKAGVNLSALESESNGVVNNVIINGKCTFTAAGNVSITGLTLQTNSDFALAVTGSAASVVGLFNCFINASNNTAISFTSSSANARINIYDCQADLGTTGITYFSHSSAGTILIRYSTLNNSGGSSTASTNSGTGGVQFFASQISAPFTTSSTSTFNGFFSNFNTTAQNVTAITHNSTGSGEIRASQLVTGTASAISIGAGATLVLTGASVINSSNASAIAGTGTLTYGVIDFLTSTTIASGLTLNFVQPFKIVVQTFTSTGTYTPTVGMMQCTIELVGGGGGGGGTTTCGAGSGSAGGGGGAGGYARLITTAAIIGTSQTVTIGSAGTAGAVGAGTGGTGGTTSVGAIISATGGVGGTGGGTSTVVSFTPGGAGGTGSSGDFNLSGSTGYMGITATAGTQVIGGSGGNSFFSGTACGQNTGTGAGGNGLNYGGGGIGGRTVTSGAQQTGGVGAAGLVVITEYVLT